MDRHARNQNRLDTERERALMAAARVDPWAFGELYDRFVDRVYAFALRRMGDAAAAEDVTTITFERAVATLRDGDFGTGSFGGWLYRVAANAASDHVRRSRQATPATGRRATDSNTGAVEEIVTSAGTDRAELDFATALGRDGGRRALAGLPEAQRQIIVLRFLDGLTVDELAAALGCTRRSAAVRLERALRALREATAVESTDVA